MSASEPELLNTIQRACHSGEGIGLGTKALHEGSKELGERFILDSDFSRKL